MKKFFEKKPLDVYLDIETAQTLGKAWGAYEVNLNKIVRPFYVLSFSVKVGNGPVKVHALPDYKIFKKDHRDDSALLEELREYLHKADVVIAHNGDRFDIKKVNTRMLMHGIRPPSPYVTVDTLKLVKKHFGFEVNKLDFVCRMLGIGRKLPHTGLDLWEECEENPKNMKAWSIMKKYNAHDVYLLTELHKKLRPWATVHPNANAFTGNKEQCPRCFSTHTVKNGLHVKVNTKTARRVQRHHCMDCGHWFLGEIIKSDN